MGKHLAIFKGEGGSLILSGKKTIESRFSKRRDPPFGQISARDLVYIKPSGGDIIGQFRVKKVIFYDGLDLGDIREIRGKYGKRLAVDETYWKKKADSRYGTLIFIGESSRFITSPVKIPKKDLRGWVVLN
ncbi:ASCH domain-containing protein [Candidatus Microgenomates bacterium]|nr:ASCH domain-containing protein [Candidatus Microgenomates bacterium]